MKGDKTRIILEILADMARSTGELLDVFLTDYHESYRRARNIGKMRMPAPPSLQELQTAERRLFYNLLAKLNAQGIIEKTAKNKWLPTGRGIAKLQTLLARRASAIPAASYAAARSPEWTIVMFDVPEKERRKRAWLRATLAHMKCKRLQKSVFAGKIKLPERFLSDLRRLRLLPYVEIFAITKTGSLKQIE